MVSNRLYGLENGGYPKSDTVDVSTDTGLVAITAGTDLIELIKAQEVVEGRVQATDDFGIKEFAIKVDSTIWVTINGKGQIAITPDDVRYAPSAQFTKSLVVSADTNINIAYAF